MLRVCSRRVSARETISSRTDEIDEGAEEAEGEKEDVEYEEQKENEENGKEEAGKDDDDEEEEEEKKEEEEEKGKEDESKEGEEEAEEDGEEEDETAERGGDWDKAGGRGDEARAEPEARGEEGGGGTVADVGRRANDPSLGCLRRGSWRADAASRGRKETEEQASEGTDKTGTRNGKKKIRREEGRDYGCVEWLIHIEILLAMMMKEKETNTTSQHQNDETSQQQHRDTLISANFHARRLRYPNLTIQPPRWQKARSQPGKTTQNQS